MKMSASWPSAKKHTRDWPSNNGVWMMTQEVSAVFYEKYKKEIEIKLSSSQNYRAQGMDVFNEQYQRSRTHQLGYLCACVFTWHVEENKNNVW